MPAWVWIGMLLALTTAGFSYMMLDGAYTNTTLKMAGLGMPQGEVDWYNAVWDALPIFIMFAGCLYVIAEAQKRGMFD